MRKKYESRIFSILLASGFCPFLINAMDITQHISLTQDQWIQTEFYQAICEGNGTRVAQMIDAKKIDPNQLLFCHYYCETTRIRSNMFSVTLTKIPVTSHLISTGWDDLYKYQKSKSREYLPLAIAIEENKSEIVKLLVETYHVKVDALYPHNPLHCAADTYNSEMITYLIEHGANPQYKDNALSYIENDIPRTVLERVTLTIHRSQGSTSDDIVKLKEIKNSIEGAFAKNSYPDPHHLSSGPNGTSAQPAGLPHVPSDTEPNSQKYRSFPISLKTICIAGAVVVCGLAIKWLSNWLSKQPENDSDTTDTEDTHSETQTLPTQIVS